MLSFIIKLLNKWLKHRRLLRQFYIEIYLWTVDGCPQHEVFGPKRALCSTLVAWGYYKKVDGAVIDRMSGLLRMQFERAGLGVSYPFNPRTPTYYEEMSARAFYKNHRRIQWLHDHALQHLW